MFCGLVHSECIHLFLNLGGPAFHGGGSASPGLDERSRWYREGFGEKYLTAKSFDRIDGAENGARCLSNEPPNTSWRTSSDKTSSTTL